LLPAIDADSMDHVVVDVAGDRQVLLHLVEPAVIDHRDWILLAVDDLLRQREVELREGDRLHDRAQRLHRSLNLCSSGGVRILSPFTSSGVLIGRTLLVTLRKPYSQLRGRMKPCFSASGA